jgi:4-hydroxybenzoate polyprenyltransferase
MNTNPFPHRFHAYLMERFPIVIVFLYSALLTAFCARYFSSPLTSVSVIVVGLTVFLFFLRTRLIDEIKDLEHDNTHYPKRPLQRGLVTTQELKITAWGIVIAEITLQSVATSSLTVFLTYVAFLVFTFFMSVDFYIRDVLERRFWLLVSLHHFVFVLIAIYAGSMIAGSIFLPLTVIDLWFLAAVLLPPLIFEIGRKLQPRKSAGKNKHANDTYASRWGEKETLSVIVLLLTLFGASVAALEQNLWILVAYSAIALILYILYKTHNDKAKVIRYTPHLNVVLCFSGLLIYIL